MISYYTACVFYEFSAQANMLWRIILCFRYVLYLIAEFALGTKIGISTVVTVVVLASKVAKVVMYIKLARRAKVERSGNGFAGPGVEPLLEEGKAYNTAFVSQPTAATTVTPMGQANNEPLRVTGVEVVEATGV